jgi:hypothetical protein
MIGERRRISAARAPPSTWSSHAAISRAVRAATGLQVGHDRLDGPRATSSKSESGSE